MSSQRTAPLLRQRDFSALWWGQLISILGERLTYLALIGLLAEHTRNFRDPRSSLLLTLLANVMLAPVLMFAPFTGVWVDRSNLKRVLIVSDLIRSGLVMLIPLLYGISSHTLPVYGLVFGLFTCNVFFLPAKSAITPEIVPPGQLLTANAWLASAGIAATAVGALAGGWMVDHWGWATALLINGGTYLWSVVALALIAYRPSRPSVPTPEISWRRYLAEVGEGWSVVRRNSRVGLALLALAAVWVAGGFLHVAGNQHIQRAARTPGMERLGGLLCVLGAGGGLGTWWINRHGYRISRAWLLGGGLLLAGAGLMGFALTRHFAAFAAAAFVIGLAAAPAFMLSETLLQESTETRQRGRVFSARDFLMRLVFLVGVSVAGVATRALGTRPTLVIGAVVVAGAGALVIAWGRRTGSEPGDPPAGGAG
jgi:MFS family permease